MTSTDVALLMALAALLLAAVFLAASEASLLRVSEFRAKALAESGERGARRLEDLLSRLPSALNMILLLALLSQIGAATVTGVLAQRWFGNVGVTLASVVLTIVLFIYGEAIPKTFAIRHAERTALRVAPVISAMERVLRPFVAALVWIADIQAPGKGLGTSPTVTETELRLLASRAAHEGEITEHDLELIERAFRFGDRRVDDIMVPRPDIVAIEAGASLDVAIDTALQAGHRRLPVYRDSLEDIIGVVRLRDLVSARSRSSSTLSDLAVPALTVPESKRVTGLLDEMTTERVHIAIVVDEHGVTAGLVTIEDVAEELLGSISEESHSPDWVKVSDRVWLVAGQVPVEDLGQLGLELPEGEWNTAAGLMIGVAGHLLRPGDRVEVDGYTLIADKVSGRRITRIRVEGPAK